MIEFVDESLHLWYWLNKHAKKALAVFYGRIRDNVPVWSAVVTVIVLDESCAGVSAVVYTPIKKPSVQATLLSKTSKSSYLITFQQVCLEKTGSSNITAYL